MTSRTVLRFTYVLIPVVTACLPTPDTGVDPGGSAVGARTEEAEPNNDFAHATVAGLDDSNRAVLAGRLPPTAEGADPGDFYSLGAVKAGERITVSVGTLGTQLVPVVGIFDDEKKLFILKNTQGRTISAGELIIDEVFRHDSPNCYLIITRAYAFPMSSGDYEVAVAIERGGTAPLPQRQTFFLDFTGGSVTIGGNRTLEFGSFDAATIDAAYANQTSVVKHWIVETFKQNYARFDVAVLNSDSDAVPSEPHSTVHFGGYDPEGLGIALDGTDPYNHDPSDDAIVFTERFTPDLFTNAPTAEYLGVAIGNIAAHEAGHLLGLNHVRDAKAVMNTYDAPDNLLTDQRFGQESLDMTVFPIFFTDLLQEQDDTLLLSETVGRAASAATSTIAVGSEPSNITVMDFNGDQHADLMVANTLSSEVSYLRNGGNAEFVAEATFFMGWGSAGSVAADFDGDGLIDLAVANLVSNNVALLRCDGAGGFLSGSVLPVQEGPTSIVAADLNGDGHMDLATVNVFAKNASILLNKGDGTFEPEVVVPAGPFPMSVAAGDMNGDGRVDLVVANTDVEGDPSGVVILWQGADGGFTGESVFREYSVPTCAAVTDVNKDGRPDIVLTDVLYDAVYVLVNEGGATFGEPVRYVVGNRPLQVTDADVNGDGYPDLITANSDSNDVSALINHGDGTFAVEWPYGVGDKPDYVAAADLDHDGDVDLAVANEAANTVSILLNRGDGTYVGPVP